jgi:hypothetical protein
MTIHRRSVFAIGIAGLLAASAVSSGQTPAPNTVLPQAAQPAQGPPPPPPPPAYTYEPEGRRDPFVSLLARGSDPSSAASRPPGLPGLLINEVIVKGIVRDRSGFIAMIQGPDTKTFIVRGGDKLMDGTVKSITADTVVFSQDVNDPLSLVKQREVRKAVRPLEDQRGGRG